MLRSAATSRPEGAASPLGPKRILAVDDSATFLGEVAEMLREQGYDVVPAKSGEEALELLALQSVDIILMDLQMPGMGGRVACRLIKSVPVLRDVPLIVLTGHDDRGAMLDALEVGADDYIQKSSDFEVLKARVRAQLRRKQFEDDNRRIRLDLLNMEMEGRRGACRQPACREPGRAARAARAENMALEQINADLARANQTKTDFLSTMSHELRTPLNAIIGFSRILKDGMSGPLQPAPDPVLSPHQRQRPAPPGLESTTSSTLFEDRGRQDGGRSRIGPTSTACSTMRSSS